MFVCIPACTRAEGSTSIPSTVGENVAEDAVAVEVVAEVAEESCC